MNEKIFEELKYHSGLVAQGCWDELDEYDREAIKRFGDIIVKRCIFEMVHESTLQSNKELQDFTVSVADRIKKRFGVI